MQIAGAAGTAPAKEQRRADFASGRFRSPSHEAVDLRIRPELAALQRVFSSGVTDSIRELLPGRPPLLAFRAEA